MICHVAVPRRRHDPCCHVALFAGDWNTQPPAIIPLRIRLMRYSSSSVALLALAISGCANQSGAQMGLFTTQTPVVGIVAGDVYTGHSIFYLNGTGIMTLSSSAHPEQQCSGDFRYESEQIGVGDMRCTGGTSATFQFRALSTMTGYGFGRAR